MAKTSPPAPASAARVSASPASPGKAEPIADPPSIDTMAVKPHDDGWALKVDDLKEPAWVVSTKKRAVQAAKDAARFHEATLRVFTQSGKLQKEFDYAAA